jgi:hypothetical protein
MSQVLTVLDFVTHLGKAVTPKGQHRTLTLVSAEAAGARGDGMTRDPFTLILRGPPGDVLPEGLYDVAVAEGPDVPLYLIPIHTVAVDRQYYQVVFN